MHAERPLLLAAREKRRAVPAPPGLDAGCGVTQVGLSEAPARVTTWRESHVIVYQSIAHHVLAASRVFS